MRKSPNSRPSWARARGEKAARRRIAGRGDGASTGVLRREDYIAPAGVHGGKIPVLAPKLDKPPLLKKRTLGKARNFLPKTPVPRTAGGRRAGIALESPQEVPHVEPSRSVGTISPVAPSSPEAEKTGDSRLPAETKRPEMQRPPEAPMRPSRPPELGKLREERRRPKDREKRDRDRGGRPSSWRRCRRLRKRPPRRNPRSRRRKSRTFGFRKTRFARARPAASRFPNICGRRKKNARPRPAAEPKGGPPAGITASAERIARRQGTEKSHQG